MSKNFKKNSSKKQPQRPRSSRVETISKSPTLVRMQAVVTRKIQYLCQTANSTNQQVTVNQLAQMLPGFMAITTVLGGFLTNQFRVRKISLWSPPPAIGSNTANSLKYADTFNATAGIAAPSQMEGDFSMEPDRPAKCSLTPEPGSVYDWYQNTGSGNNFFVFTAPIGSIFEFTYQHYIDDSGSITTGPTIVAATPGVIYHKIITLSQGQVLSPHTSLNGI